jgi:hypothetical protein
MNRTNKKAVSAVVATVLIIMITVAAVGIIWAAIIPMVRDSLSKGTVCNDAMSDISIGVEGYTCKEAGGNISLQIKKGSNAKVQLVAVNALVFEGGSSTSVRINATNTYTGTTVNISGNLPGSNVDQVIILANKNYTNATSIKIAPVVTVGKTEETCAATQEVALSTCK